MSPTAFHARVFDSDHLQLRVDRAAAVLVKPDKRSWFYAASIALCVFVVNESQLLPHQTLAQLIKSQFVFLFSKVRAVAAILN